MQSLSLHILHGVWIQSYRVTKGFGIDTAIATAVHIYMHGGSTHAGEQTDNITCFKPRYHR